MKSLTVRDWEACAPGGPGEKSRGLFCSEKTRLFPTYCRRPAHAATADLCSARLAAMCSGHSQPVLSVAGNGLWIADFGLRIVNVEREPWTLTLLALTFGSLDSDCGLRLRLSVFSCNHLPLAGAPGSLLWRRPVAQVSTESRGGLRPGSSQVIGDITAQFWKSQAPQ